MTVPWTLATMLVDAADHHGDVDAFGFLDGRGDRKTITYGELDRRARRVAAAIADLGSEEPGRRSLILAAPGLDYIVAFFGAVYAGTIAVPAYPPDPMRLATGVQRLDRLIAGAQPEVLLTTSDIAPFLLEEPVAPLVGGMEMLLVDAPLDDTDRRTSVDGSDIAFLQYTSGSTGAPRGVAVSHANLRDNLTAIAALIGGEHAPGCVWVPPYHDMGLIGGIFGTIFTGTTTDLMAPATFLKQPAAWLHAMSDNRAAWTCAPDFSFELCARKVTDEQADGLDLSNLRVAINGAEPVRSASMNRFMARFAPHGLRPDALYPAYGLAEATLLVSSRTFGPGSVLAVDRSSLKVGARIELGDDDGELVSCGPPISGADLKIVGADGRAVDDGVIGEIHIHGPSVAAGYWVDGRVRSPAVALDGVDTRRYLPTGDLGFLLDGELYITGRVKDLIVLRGRNFYPQDLERSVEAANSQLKPGCSAVFGIDDDVVERVVCVAEVRDGCIDLADVVTDIRAHLARVESIQMAACVLIPPRTLPKTSSGKVQRGACREHFRAGTLDGLHQWDPEFLGGRGGN